LETDKFQTFARSMPQHGFAKGGAGSGLEGISDE